MPAVAGLALIATMVVVGVAGGLATDNDDERADGPATSPAPAATGSSLLVAAPVVTTATTATPQKTALTRTLEHGVAGDDVSAMQERLKALGFDPGPIDG